MQDQDEVQAALVEAEVVFGSFSKLSSPGSPLPRASLKVPLLNPRALFKPV